MRKGFTLIELIVVIAIIAILAAIVAPNAFKAVEKSRISGVQGDLRTIKTAAMSYYSDTGNWPSNNNYASFIANDGTPGWNGPYMEKWPVHNPWSGAYVWHNDNAGTFAAGGTNERWVEALNVTPGSAQKVDTNLDDGNLTNGIVRATGTSLRMEISDDTY